MSKCGICEAKIGQNKAKLSCNDCKQDFHGSCLGMSKADIECIVADDLVWRCTKCASTRRKSMRLDAQANEGQLTLEDIMKVVNEIRDMQRKGEKDVNTAYESLNEKIDENTRVLSEQNSKMDSYLKKIEDLTVENNKLKEKIALLESRLDDTEQYSRSNCVEIHGIPQERNEDVVSVVKEVGTALNLPITDNMIDTCHRLGRRPGPNNQPPAIIVKFVRRLDKEELMKKRRIKSNFSTRHLNLTTPTDNPIYINESLSPARRRLFVKAKEVKVSKKFKYLWVRNGKIFLRRDEGQNVIPVTCLADLSKF